MTLSPLLFKAVVGTTLVAGSATAASFTIYQSATQEGIKQTTNSVVLVSSLTSLTTNPKLTVDSTDHEYKCKISGAATEICRLVKLDLSKNWIDVNGIKKAKASGTVKLTDLNADSNHFKLEVNQPLYDKAVLTENKHIEIISTTTANKKLAKLNVSFKVSGSEIDYVSTKHLLGRLETAPASIDDSTTHQCFLTTPTTLDPTKACSIFPFGSAQTTFSGPRYHRQTVSDLLATASTGTLTQHHNFVIEHTTPLTKAAIAAKKTLYLKKLDNSTLSGNGKLENVVPVIIQGTNKKAFILSETPSYSIIVKKDTQLVSGKTITHTNSAKNYQCKYDASEAFGCDLVELDLSDTKTSMNVADIKNADLTTDLSVAQEASKIQYFKLDVPLAQFETIKASLASTPSGVELVEITDANSKIGDLTPIFAIDDNNSVHFDTSSYIVKSATLESDAAPFTDGQKKYCAFAESDSSPLSDAKECEIKYLDTSIDTNTDFASTADVTSITEDNTYLVTFVETSGVTLPTAQDIQDKPLLFLQVASDEGAKTKVAIFTKEHIKPALVVDAESPKKYSFFLNSL